MGENSAIQWTTHTMNFWFGCTEVSPGCDFCYARELMDSRYHKVTWGHGAARVRTAEATWRQAWRWNRQAAAAGERHRVFSLSLGDFFDAEAPAEWRREAWAIIRETPALDWLILTKRPNLIRRYLPPDWGDGYPNVWLGVSVENAHWEWRVDALRAVPAAVRFLSLEPLLGAVPNLNLAGVAWVIVGGESGVRARPFDLGWAREIVAQCREHDTAPFVKQLGARPVGDWGERSHPFFVEHWRLKDRHGGDIAEFPDDLRIREFPQQPARPGQEGVG